MPDYTLSDLTTAVVGVATTSPSTGKTINASVTNSGASDYSFSGDIVGLDTGFIMIKGDTLKLSINASGHPFWIQKISGAYSSGNVITENITNNGTQSSIITWKPSESGTFYYVCQNHSSMAGIITVTEFDSVVIIPANNGTRSIGDISGSLFEINKTTTTIIPSKRPQRGQLYPRGVYNK